MPILTLALTILFPTISFNSDGRLFVSNTFGLVSFELSLRKPPPGAAPPLLLEPLASDAGVSPPSYPRP
eukprot:2475115-Rhodomonas_salina.1